MGNPAVPVPSTTILSTWGADVVSRVVAVFADAAARDQALPAPDTGRVAYMEDIAALVMFDGFAWIRANEGVTEHAFTGQLAGSHLTVVGSFALFAVHAVGPYAVYDNLGVMPAYARPSQGHVYVTLGYDGASPSTGSNVVAVGSDGDIWVMSGRDIETGPNYRGSGMWIVGAKGAG